ncbi:anti-sigma regulatory factor [Amycolatopsis sp. NBRC 101858]|uniref:ATP-binding protein n=1 Tax=Amycolatopsis sp. NBRC 101858 TaxID=3032200 RepID=UPI0024A5419A|nr:ATP-binding protein [Amycolatopsis sp. NBRC 101858]GLY42934.1 anti-sigma regulatory factor [Amycolatopsis sp. NBRC 101858]
MPVPTPAHGPAGDPSSPCGDTAPEDLRRDAVPADPGQLALLRDELAAWGMRAGLSTETSERVLLAAYEAMANVVVHAYGEETGVLDLRASSRGDLITVTVTDYGRWQAHARPGPLHGRGLPLIHTLADKAAFTTGPSGTEVAMS